MELKVTKREEFLMNMVLYLSNCGDLNSSGKRNQLQIEKILNNPKTFFDIDVIDDELSYFGLDSKDFEWQ